MAARYKIELSPAAERQLERLPSKMRERILAAMARLEQNPRHQGVKKLSGEHEMYRVRVGDYRILFEIEHDRLLVLVLRVARRDDAYRGM
jgi:mRNA interferase RelE/StbE